MSIGLRLSQGHPSLQTTHVLNDGNYWTRGPDLPAGAENPGFVRAQVDSIANNPNSGEVVLDGTLRQTVRREAVRQIARAMLQNQVQNGGLSEGD